jgi:hypothetical protein
MTWMSPLLISIDFNRRGVRLRQGYGATGKGRRKYFIRISEREILIKDVCQKDLIYSIFSCRQQKTSL